MLDVIRKVLALLSPQERRRAYLLLGMILVMALLDVVGIASIMPFMAVLANPDVVNTNAYLNTVYTALGFSTSQDFLFFLGVMVFVAMVVSIGFKALTIYALTRFTLMRNYSIGRRLVAAYLRQPYEWFLDRHSADLGKNVLTEVQLVIVGAVMPLMHLLAQGAVVLAILVLLILVDPLLAIVVGVGLGMSYGFIYFALRRVLTRAGAKRVEANADRFKVLGEAFGGIKEVKVRNLETTFIERFDAPAAQFSRMQVINTIAGALPRYALEILAFGGMLLLVLYLMRSSGGLQGALPILALYALAGYRILPALQMAYSHATHLRFSGAALDKLHTDFVSCSVDRDQQQKECAPLVPEQFIALDGITYTYPGATGPAVRDLCLEIPVRSTVGLVGATGSGKTTSVDIILGLLEPQCGMLLVDGTSITRANRQAWQRTIGYVPQQIFLADETVAANIAFGVSKEQIDQQSVERAARIANLHQFVIDELPEGYETLVGERGVRLSGGQRQRIGIARALYHNPKALILDEATSALDNLTEQAVMDAVHNLGGEITIVMIAHRLSTVRECDRIYLLEHGAVAGQGSYEELAASNARFRSMAGA